MAAVPAMKGLRFKSSAAWISGTRTFSNSLSTAGGRGRHHSDVLMDFVFFVSPPPFYEGTLAEFEPTLEKCWYGRVVLLCRVRVKTDMKDDNGRSVLKDCNCALIDCLYDYAPGRYKCNVFVPICTFV